MVNKLLINRCHIVNYIQDVVTYMSPIEAFATGIKIFDRQKVYLIA